MNVRMSRKWLVSLSVTLGMLILLWAIGSAMAQGPEPEGDISVAATVNSRISYQGVLKQSGQPVTGTVNMTFRLYSDSSCTTQVGTDIVKSGVAVVDGLFSVALDVDHHTFNGQGLWLELEVGGTQVSCQEILPAPYALSLRPGGIIAGEAAGTNFGEAVVNIDNTAASWLNYPALYVRTGTGSAVRGESSGVGLYGKSTWTYAVQGTSITGTAGYFSSQEGYGIRASTSGTDHWDHGGYFSANKGYGVYATSTYNMGVRGEAGSISGLSQPGGPVGVVGIGESGGVFGSSDSGYGVYGTNSTGSAVRGESTGGNGIYGYTESAYGVYGVDSGTPTTYSMGYGGYFTSVDGVGVYGYSGSDNVYNNMYAPGVYGRSANGVGVYGVSESTSSWRTAGVFGYGTGGPGGKFMSYLGNPIEGWEDANGDGYTLRLRFKVDYNGNVYADGGYNCGQTDPNNSADDLTNDPCLKDQSGADFAEVLPVVNDPEPGDVLTIGPDGRLTPSTVPYQPTVVGVYSARPSYVGGAANLDKEGYAPLAMVGLVPVKASAENGPIAPGDLLVASATPGHAMRADPDPPTGTVVGKALEPLDGGTGVIQMLVMLQ